MTSHRGKSGKRDDQALTMEAISELLEQHRQSLADDFKTSFNQLENKFDEVRSTVDEHGQCLSSLELAADDLSQRVGELESVCANLQESNSKLTAKVIDLEGRSRRQNIRILGLAESIEGFWTLPSQYEIDRAHRSLTAKPAPSQRLRPVILRLHRYQIKDLLVREAHRRGKLAYRGQQIRVVEDYSPDVQSKASMPSTEQSWQISTTEGSNHLSSILHGSASHFQAETRSGSARLMRHGNTSMTCLHLFHRK
ncbi:hypothetical protein JOB18_017492 [Solea senegalensis]|uniref:Uncharacterized protein n=1 Tax=Solea senegalensis TaxID=28829 RepID=A0AAV6PBI6_SOLSE|nr:hypothetical protein JOB18_017492 [Solea senegalensis]